MFGAAALNSLDIFFVLQNLHASARVYGFLSTAMGFGLILGAILTAIFAQRIGLVRTLNLCLLSTGAAILVYSRLSNFVAALVCMFIAGFFQAGLNAAVGPLLLRVTPRVMVGRVAGLINPTLAMMQILGTILAGYLASAVFANFHRSFLGITFGQIDTIFTGGALIALVGTLYSVFRLGFRDPPASETLSAPAAVTPPVEATVGAAIRS